MSWFFPRRLPEPVHQIESLIAVHNDLDSKFMFVQLLAFGMITSILLFFVLYYSLHSTDYSDANMVQYAIFVGQFTHTHTHTAHTRTHSTSGPNSGCRRAACAAQGDGVVYFLTSAEGIIRLIEASGDAELLARLGMCNRRQGSTEDSGESMPSLVPSQHHSTSAKGRTFK